MKRIYFTLTGTNHHYGHEFFEPEKRSRLNWKVSGTSAMSPTVLIP